MKKEFQAAIIATVTATLFTYAGCASQGAGPRIPRATSTSATPTNPPIMTAPTTSPESVASAPTDLRQVDWLNIPVPGQFCGVSGLVTFSNGSATAPSSLWGPVNLTVGALDQEVVFGDLDGDGRDEAAVSVGCDNGGGTAGGQLAFAFVMFSAQDGHLDTIGTITPQKQDPGVHVTLIKIASVLKGRVTVEEAWYRPSDPTCCPSGSAVTVWKLERGQLSPGPPNVTS